MLMDGTMFTLKILAADSMKHNELKKHLERVQTGCFGKTHELFHRN
jgi:hypothetical protein